MYHIFHKTLATGLPVFKTLFKFNYNSLEEKNEKEMEPIDIEFTNQKYRPEMMKMLFTLDDVVYKKKTRKILLWLTSLRAYISKLMRKIFLKK